MALPKVATRLTNGLFSVELEGFLRDRRFTDFVLKRDPQRKLSKFIEEVLKPYQQEVINAYSSPPIFFEGGIANNVELKSEVSSRGIFEAEIFVDEKKVPYAHSIDKGKGPGKYPPTAPIRHWVENKLGLSGTAAKQATRAIQLKIGREGYNNNKAPYQVFAAMEQKMRARLNPGELEALGVWIARIFNTLK